MPMRIGSWPAEPPAKLVTLPATISGHLQEARGDLD